MKKRYIFTSESVSPGHPDKTCDIISDSLLDFVLSKDPFARCAFETFATKDNIIVGGETRINGYTLTSGDIEKVVRDAIKQIGHNYEGFHYNDVKITNLIHRQSPDIAIGVDEAENKEEGAGDQGIMFGFACKETNEYMPSTIYYSHKILKNIWNSELLAKGLGPDAKSQVSIIYEDGIPIGCHSVVVSIQHKEEISLDGVRSMIIPIIEEALPSGWMPNLENVFINPTGRFVIGGPVSDTGLTGRKIIVDTYGGAAPHGGGAFCVDGDTEYLSGVGVWKKIKDYDGGKVGQWDNGILSFVTPKEYIKTKSDKMHHFISKDIDMVLSENHDIVAKEKGIYQKVKVKDVLLSLDYIKSLYKNEEGIKLKIPCTFKLGEIFLKESIDRSNLIKLKVLSCLYGEFSNDGFSILIPKIWISKVVELLCEFKIPLEIISNKDGEGVIIKFKPVIEFLELYENFKTSSIEEWGEVLKSLKFYFSPQLSVEFYCLLKNSRDADFIQFLYSHIENKKSEILKQDSGLFKVQGYSDNVCILDEKIEIKEFKPQDDLMYCFEVPSGMLVLRRNNKIFVTGNSGKDPTKVDRSAAYMARYLAKNIVANGYADKCLIQLSYVIGVSKPISVYVNTFNTSSKYSDIEIGAILNKIYDLSPKGIRTFLNLNRPIYKETASFGHFGRYGFTWEEIDENFLTNTNI